MLLAGAAALAGSTAHALGQSISIALANRAVKGGEDKGRPLFSRIIGGWRHSHSQAGAYGKRELDRRKRQIACAQLRVHHGPPRILHRHLPGSEAPAKWDGPKWGRASQL